MDALYVSDHFNFTQVKEYMRLFYLFFILLRSVLLLYSSTLCRVLSTIQCCQSVAVSLPFPTKVLRWVHRVQTLQTLLQGVPIKMGITRRLENRLRSPTVNKWWRVNQNKDWMFYALLKRLSALYIKNIDGDFKHWKIIRCY